MNVLWEMAAAERVLHGVLEGARGLINGVTCGAGMPYKIAEICARYVFGERFRAVKPTPEELKRLLADERRPDLPLDSLDSPEMERRIARAWVNADFGGGTGIG